MQGSSDHHVIYQAPIVTGSLTDVVAGLCSGCFALALIDHGKGVFRGSPTKLISRAKGAVYEMRMSHQDEAQMTFSLEIVSREESEKQVRIRAVSSKESLPAGARPVEDPNLEKAYLAFTVIREHTKDAQPKRR